MVVSLDNEEMQESIRQMKDTEGWTHVEDFINKRIHYHEQQLYSCDVSEVLEHRNKRETFKSVLLFVDEKGNGES